MTGNPTATLEVAAFAAARRLDAIEAELARLALAAPRTALGELAAMGLLAAFAAIVARPEHLTPDFCPDCRAAGVECAIAKLRLPVAAKRLRQSIDRIRDAREAHRACLMALEAA